MDEATIAQHLAQAERHVAKGEELVARQRELVSELALAGHVHAFFKAEQTLEIFEEIQASHIADRDRLRSELAKHRG